MGRLFLFPIFNPMRIEANSISEYYDKVPEERKEYILKLHKTIADNIPDGFEQELGYGMPSFVVPKSIYPAGYHCKPNPPLPFITIGSQKNFIALYHSGIYAKKELHDWFVAEYPKHCKRKLDMGKSCIRFKKPEEIPFELIAELAQKMTVQEWIDIYESAIKN